MEDADDSTIATLNTLGNNTLTTFNSTIYTTSTLAFPPVSADYGDVTLSQKAKQASVTRLKHQHGLVALLNLLKQSDLAPTGLLHKTESSYLQSTITEEKRVILEVFEVYEVRRKVDTVWFTLLKVIDIVNLCGFFVLRSYASRGKRVFASDLCFYFSML